MGTQPHRKWWFGLERWQALLSAIIAAVTSVVVALVTVTSGGNSQGTNGGPATPSGSVSVPAISTDGPPVNVAPDQEEKATVSCPPGTRVTGGGGSGPGIVYLTDSFPAGDSGWTVYAYNPDLTPHKVRAWAMCSKTVPPGANKEHFTTPPITIDPGTNRSASVTCPQGQVVIGGGGSGPGMAYLTGSYPANPDEWVVSATNPGDSQLDLKARALCGPEPSDYLPFSGHTVSIAPGQDGSASVTCPGVPLSGGGRISGGPGTYLTDSYVSRRSG